MGYKALRHTYGFGVHSPFAFRMVKDVVRPGRVYSWYGYEDIDAAVNSRRAGMGIERRAKMFHRLLCFLNPSSLFLQHGADPIYFTAASTSGKGMRIERKPRNAESCEMIASHGDFIPLDTLKRHIAAPGHSIILLDGPHGWSETLFDMLPEGLMFHSKKNAIIVNRPGMMKVKYSMII